MCQVSLVVEYTNLIYIFVNIYGKKTLNKERKIAEKLKWVYLQNYLYLIC